jgi:hypothetical protein
MEIEFHPEAERELLELRELSVGEHTAMLNALAKLQAIGALLDFPHTSQVRDAANLRELRPRAGRSPWRAFYRRVGDVMRVAAVGPEAKHDERGFRAAVKRAVARLETP